MRPYSDCAPFSDGRFWTLMTLLSRFTRQPPASKPANAADTAGNPGVDLDSQSAEFVLGLALSEGEEALRLAAIARIHSIDALCKLSGLTAAAPQAQPPSQEVQRAAQARIAQLVESGAVTFDDVRRQAGDDSALTTLAVHGATTRIRQLAAEAMTDPQQIQDLLKDVRGKDKNVYKIIRQKCDAILAVEKAAAERQAAIEALCAALEKHTHLPFDNLYAPTLEHLCANWSQVADHASGEDRARAELAIDRCRAVITRHLQDVASQAARANAIASADADRQAVLAELRKALAALYEEPEHADRRALLAQCADRWAELASYKAPNKSDAAQYDALQRACDELSALLAQAGSIAKQAAVFEGASADADLQAQAKQLKSALAHAALLGDATPAAAMHAMERVQSWERARADKEAAHAKALKQVASLIRAASGALANGQSRQAAGMRRAIEDKLELVNRLPEHVSRQLEQLDEKLKELQDWRSYAVAPKRIELIERMEALIDSGAEPNALAEQIKRLQDEWKLISKGNTDNTDAEWQRFHEAAQKAFAPCREYFAKQAKLREDNLQRRKALLERVAKFAAEHDWEQPDWREVARAVRESRQQWRGYQPVERGPNKPLQERFEAVLGDLQTRLDAEYEKNATAKRRLIARAQGLAALEDSRKAIDEVKRLQAAWKEVGIVAHEEDQKLWAEFRQHCDAVFAKRDQQRTEYVGALDANKIKAIALCEEAEQVGSLSGAALVEAVKKLPALREAFDAVGELPKASARDIQRRFSRAVERVEQAIAKQREHEKAQAWTRVLEAGDKIRLYRLSVAENAAPEQCDSLKQDAQAFIDGVEHWPKGALQAVKNELSKTGSTDFAANELALRTLCIRAEILTDTPTPAEDQSLRREFQLRRLTQRMGQGATAPDDMNALTLEWIAVGPTPTAAHQSLLERFNRCRLK